MTMRGANLPGFQAEQLAFSAYIRNPAVHPVPEGIEARRMKIYADLFYRNIESFMASAFPVTKRIFLDPSWTDTLWAELMRQFIHHHPSESPYFQEISQEFLQFMSDHEIKTRHPWLLEFLHYEWVELALGVSDETWPDTPVDREGDLLGPLVVSPLVWPLAYTYAVQNIGPGHLPAQPPETLTLLMVYRRPDDTVHFMASSPMTHRLLELIGSGLDGQSAIQQIATESGLNPDVFRENALRALSKLRDVNIILGASK